MIDTIIVGVPVGLLKSAVLQKGAIQVAANISVDPWTALFSLLYFAVSEGFWGTTPGKRLCGLRVEATKGEMSWRHGLARSFIFQSPQLPLLMLAVIFGVGPITDYLTAHRWLAGLASMGPTLASVLMFATMRRMNGLAAVHDLLTGTRVVTRRTNEFRAAAAVTTEGAPAPETGLVGARFGPFVAGRVLGDVPGGRLLEGVDTVLKRRVWLVEREPGAPEISRARRDVDRVGRLHWLAGRRASGENAENWDAFEAPQGAPVNPVAGESSWRRSS